MAEYIEREAAIKIVNTPNYNKHDMLFALKTIPAASAADVREVVLCKDCKFWECPTAPTHNKHFCDYWESGTYDVDFCSRGEKRDGGVNDG